jgi:putative ABC transport system substrate-binding protein
MTTKLTPHLKTAAAARGVKVRSFHARVPGELDGAFNGAHREAQALLVLPDPFTTSNRGEITSLAAVHRIPALYVLLEFMDSGGLMAYGVDNNTLFRRAADYVDKILKGARAGDLPIEQPTKFQLIVNLNTAKSLGITVPRSILARADEVIK